MPSVRTVVRILIAAFLIAAPLLMALEAPAGAQAGNPTVLSGNTSRTDRAVSNSPTVSIDSVSPNFAEPGKRITVRGTVTNNTGSPVSGLQIAMQTASTAFGTRSAMEGYVSGASVSSGYLATNQVGGAFPVPGVFHTGTTVNWSVSFPASDGGYPGFGVYPLAAVVYDSSFSPLATDRTLLPYWPGNGSAQPLRASWIWPLVDQPKKGPCPQGLADNTLASSLEPSGRLGGLLNAGLSPAAGAANLTWAVDPALLADAQVMTTPYKTGGSAGCSGTTGEPASQAAKNWLDSLDIGTAGQPMFVTPYADADMTALAHAGLLANTTPSMQSAYSTGERVASQVLRRPFGQAGTGDGGAPSAAWLPGGPTDSGVLSALNETGRVNTVVLGSGDEPSMTSTVNEVPVRSGSKARVLLADSQLTSVLGSATAGSSPGAQFAAEQDFLAETAMITAEAPSESGRSIIIAPPRRWAPPVGEAKALLNESVQAPWLRPAKLSSVASSAAQPQRLPFYQHNADQLPSSYMRFLRAVGRNVRTYKDLLYNPPPAVTQSLQAAMVSTASSAWRGVGGGTGTANLIDLAEFVHDSERKVQIIAGDKYLLAGASGDIAVSVRNGMTQPVQIAVRAGTLPDAGAAASVGQLSVGKFDALMTISPGKTGTVKIPVQARGIETTTLRLQLVTRNGTPLSWTQQPLTVQVTRYGRALIILIGAALGVVVLASGVRWVRQWRNGTTAGSEAPDDKAESATRPAR